MKRYYDVFVHRDVEGMRMRDEKRKKLEIETKGRTNKLWGWSIQTNESSETGDDESDTTDEHYDYV
jgi:hypothetical protein